MICPWCSSDPVFRFVEMFGLRDYVLGACCEEAEAQLENFGDWPADDRRAALAEAAADLGLPRVRGGGTRLDFKLRDGPVAQRECFAQIDAHHRHHPAPRGWKFGVGCYNGPTLVGTAVVGRPVNRVMQARGFLEVTRVCVHAEWPDEYLARHAASKLYAAAIAGVKALGVAKLMTYTLEHETGSSFRHLGFEKVWLTKGGSWDTPGRRRTDKAPTGRKWLWIWPKEIAQLLRSQRENKPRRS